MVRTHERKSAEERREEIVEIAIRQFAISGYNGTSTEAIAREAGISQPYLFRLFGTKKELFMAASARCLGDMLEAFQRASEGLGGEEALQRIGEAYMELITENPNRLRGQMQAYAACDDPEICAVVRRGFGDLVEFVQATAGADEARLSRFFARGMLLNVIASMELIDSDEPWAKALIEGCRQHEE